MAEDVAQTQQAAAVKPVKPLNLIPVTIKEAALDSPTFRSTAQHSADQLELIERWLDNYVKSASRLASEATALDSIVGSFLSNAIPPQDVSETVLDHDYTLLALRRYQEGARDWWNSTLRSMKRLEIAVCQPVRVFLQGDLKLLKDARRTLESTQRNFDALVARYASQSKMKEPSSLREDAFQLHEARKAYLKASMDFCVLAPIVRATLDQLLVKILAEQWKDMKQSRETGYGPFTKLNGEMDRVRGWAKEMENSERMFKRELHTARKQIEDSAELAARPSRELDGYALSTVPFLGATVPASSKPPANVRAEKQGWLFQRTMSGKPARTLWVRRWFFVKNGIFGWLVQGLRSGAVEESDKIGVLLCGIRPAFQEERRFCFEVKTKDSTIMLQAETQSDLTDWISAFDVVKRKTLENPAGIERLGPGSAGGADPAFAITPPIAPELAAKVGEGHASHLSDDLTIERAATLAVPDSGVTTRGSFDITKRSGAGEGESSSSREQYNRIMQKLDLSRKSTATPPVSSSVTGPALTGGIASLISASHAIMPINPGAVQVSNPSEPSLSSLSSVPASTLAPSTLAHPPAPTNLSKTAVIVSGERGLSVGRADGGMPGGLLANHWGTTNWGYFSSVERGEVPPALLGPGFSPLSTSLGDTAYTESHESSRQPSPSPTRRARSPSLPSGGSSHRKSASVADAAPRAVQMSQPQQVVELYPNYYPIQLKAQDAQFRLLFPYVPRSDRLVLVFRATWNPTDQQEFPGRVYVTTGDLYFYSHHIGLVLITAASLSSISEVTAAPGRDCDFIFLHFKESARQEGGASRITIKTFLEPLRLLQRRLNYLVRNCNSNTPAALEEVMKHLIKLEVDREGSGGNNNNNGDNSPSVDSWEDVDVNTPVDALSSSQHKHSSHHQDLRTAVRVDGTLYPDQNSAAGAGTPAKKPTKFKLPTQPVEYTPPGFIAPTAERELGVSAKSLFHVLCGDKSAIFQLLYCGMCADACVQRPWTKPDETTPFKRELLYTLGSSGQGSAVGNGKGDVTVETRQTIDVLNNHLCYVVTNRDAPWYLPATRSFSVVTKIVITHVSKARCRLSLFTRVDWVGAAAVGKKLIETRAKADLERFARDLVDLLEGEADKVKGTDGASSTRRALTVFGDVGAAKVTTQIVKADLPGEVRAQVAKVRFRPRPTSLAALGLDFAGEVGNELVSGLLGVIAAGLQAVFKLVTAHGLLVALLVASALANMVYVQRDGSSWWRERAAIKYMSALGVGNTGMTMGRAVWLKDIDDYIGNISYAGARHRSGRDGIDQQVLQDAMGNAPAMAENRCAAQFKLALQPYRKPRGPASAADQQPATPSTASRNWSTRLAVRLQRTRDLLASQRHDLLVALRVVNRVERELVRAEFSSFAAAEARSCARVEVLLASKTDGAGKGRQDGGGEGREGWRDYCNDCNAVVQAEGIQ